jgi:hypothetical protein
MLAKLRSHLTYANVVSTICLFVVLGGTAVAAGGINSIGAIQLRANAVGESEIKKNAVTASEVKKNAIGASELKASAVGAAELKRGAVTSDDIQDKTLRLSDFDVKQLPPGPQGLRGPEGDPGATDVRTYSSAQDVCNVQGCESVANVPCPTGTRPTGGGGYTVGDNIWSASAPNTATVGNGATPTGWQVRFTDPPGGDAGSNAVATVICASP